jgi:hypothetical protein
MDLAPPNRGPFRLTDSRQIRIHERLARLVGAGPSTFFYDACRLIEQIPPYVATTHLVAHMVREIESALRDVLEPVSGWSQRPKNNLKSRGQSPKEGHKEEVRFILAALGLGANDPVAKKWLELSGRSSEGALHRRAHRPSLARPRPLDNDFREFWDNSQAVLEAVLARLELRFSEFQKLIDLLTTKDVPTSKDIQILRNNIPNNLSTLNYFFNKLKSPHWLRPLRETGIFKEIADLVRHDDGISCPQWPAAEYLKLNAKVVPQEVEEVLREAPETDNWLAVGHLADLARMLPGKVAIQWSKRTVRWIRRQGFLGLGLALKLGELASSFAKRGEIGPALQFLEALLSILGDPKKKEKDADDSPFRNLREPSARIDFWQYEQILSKNVPDLVDAAGEQALGLLCDLLDRAILLSDRRGTKRRPDDLSYIWRSAIEEHQQNLNMGAKHLLVISVRDPAERIGRSSPASVPAIVEMLEKRGESWWVFRRVALHILRLFPKSAPNLIRERLVSRVLFDSVDVRHEYFLLERECFDTLASDEQKVILGWIDDGPKYSEEQLKRWEEFTGRPWTSEDKFAYVRQWKRDHLAPLETHLEGKWKDTYAKLLSEEGQPKHPEFTSYHEGWAWGPQSPQRREDLAKLSAKEMVAFLGEWKPTGDCFRGASPEGLGRELTEVIAGEPESYAAGAAEFQRLSEPTYVRSILQGFHDALKQKRGFRWPLVLDLCTWAVGQTREIPGRSVGRFEMDAHWGWTRAAVSRLITDGFTSEENPIPFDLRDKVWPGIEAGTHDPEPTPEQEGEYFKGAAKDRNEEREGGGRARAFDPFTNSMNTPRGVAMEAVVRYALWVRSGFEKSKNVDLLAQGFEAMPEVREVLDFHLNAENDPSVTIRTIYGQRAPWLQLLDEKWAQENTSLIFPRNNSAFWHAAWDTYVCYGAAYDKVFEWLRDEYAYAVEKIGSHDHGWAQTQAPDYSLAQHLISFFWRGKLEYESDIIGSFYRRADPRLRGHALNFIGRSLRNTKEAIPKQIAERLKGFWERRVEAAKLQPEACAEEQKEYGWWFASSKLDDEWSVHQLLEALRLAKRVEPDHLVVERLVDMAKAMLRISIRALEMIIEGDTKSWGVLGWSDKAKKIIRTARKSGDPVAHRNAEDLVNLLGRRGHFDFGDLLKEPVE